MLGEVIDPNGRRPLSLSDSRTMHAFRVTRAGFYQIRFANGRDAMIGVNPDRRESNLEPLPDDVLRTWSRRPNQGSPQVINAASNEATNRSVSLWWYVMLLALATALVEMAVASGYMGTQREAV